jgi:hypothetical protein
MAYIGKQPAIGNFVKLDAISVVNGQASYTMQNGGANFTEYSNVNQFLVSLNGILQSPTDSFTVSGSTITFASNLITGDVIDFIIVLGNSLDVGVPSDNTVSLAKLTATGTKDATTFLRGDNTFAEAGGGIEEADQWRLTADFTGGADPISSNLEQVDTGSQGTIGSAMTVSSGIFTFPSTGIWLVMFNLDAFTTTTDGLITLLIQATTDNSTYNNIARGNAGIDYPNGNTIEASATTYSLVDVTDTTQVKVKFKADSINPTTTVKGDTALNETFFTFIRLGDT